MSSNKRYLLLVSAGGSFVAPFMVSGLLVATPTIGIEFQMDSVGMGWLITAFFLAASMFLVPFGRIADVIGVKKVFTIGIIIYFVTALASALSTSSIQLITARFVTGIDAAMIFGTSFALLSLSLPENERGGGIGINIAGNLFGFALGFLAGGFLTHYSSWRSIFLATLPIDLLVVTLILLRLPEEYALSKCKSMDFLGMTLNVMMLFSIIIGFSKLPEIQRIFFLLLGLAILLSFVFWEMHVNCPVVNVSLFADNRSFALANLAALIYFTSSFAGIFLLSLYMQYIRDLDDRLVGTILMLSTLIMAFFVSYSGKLSDRISPDRIAAMGIVITSISLAFFPSIDSNTSIGLIIAALVLLLTGGAFFQPPIVKRVLDSINREMHATGSSLVEMMRLVGQTLSMAIVVLFFTFYLGGTEIVPKYYDAFLASLNVIFLAFFVLCLISLILTVLIGQSGNAYSD
ncbi:MAG: MFS transporter [Methanotrichaceae archaeon]|nr:MFS transporter [Methanotrichaceae archaeon]